VDGEGTIYARIFVNKKGFNQTTLRLQVMMYSEAVTKWLHKKFAGEFHFYKKKDRRHECFYWRLQGQRVGPVLRALLPYMIEKKERALLAIQLSDALAQMRCGGKRKVPNLTTRNELAASIRRLNNPDDGSELTVQ